MELLPKTPTSQGPAERFTGDVWVDMLAEAAPSSRLTAGIVRFAPCARTAWHRHALGQTLYVTEGIGLVQTRDGHTIVLRPGDTVHTPPGEWHWHGATPDRFMTHLALSERTDEPGTADVEWGEHVDDETYRKAAQAR
ncbi:MULTISPECIES: cupin domain-containing protein [unclassified Streptomyces]|uniref:(R)-mandelonitrile lyase n=1 Tax=unclassified Streptomyces TaxID=2593676 RepID=UPI001654C3E8|nr:cupin domain-containing protein [Streptomyces sp. CB02980]MCB8902064.1 cupin domain-containing protein [Streptomyces sp. CB02980]